MNKKLIIELHSVHLWRTSVPDLLAEIPNFFNLLNKTEKERAKRFHFVDHQHRYVIAHAVLRHILTLYTGVPAGEIEFSVGERGKPYLKENALNLQFNLSHSHDWVVYALTLQKEVGVDIEKMEPTFNEGVAKRFFSASEYTALMALPSSERMSAFYRIWAGKEAIIKALGEGLYAPLADFSLDFRQETQRIALTHQTKTHHFFVNYFLTHPTYQSAVATETEVNKWLNWEWTTKGPFAL